MQANHQAAEKAIFAAGGRLIAEWPSIVSGQLAVFDTFAVGRGVLVIQRIYGGKTAASTLQHVEVLRPMGTDNRMDTLLAEIQACATVAEPLPAATPAMPHTPNPVQSRLAASLTCYVTSNDATLTRKQFVGIVVDRMEADLRAGTY
jgi:hypothetical protein